MNWVNKERPGYFGRRRDEKIEELNAKYGRGNWQLRWFIKDSTSNKEFSLDFLGACINFYEVSYMKFLQANPKEVDFICSFGEVVDNSMTNIDSGCDYTCQESYSTHIQDIAIRNVLRKLGRKFKGESSNILVVRSRDSNGFRFNPGNIPFFDPQSIIQPSIKPSWANVGSVEDFWQSNKFVQVFE